ncbi:MAG: MFS transporter [Propionibacteriales bacterium]|nr:MFS transporter [Propionibacteriales bacterium]
MVSSGWFRPVLPLAAFVLLVSTVAWVRVPVLPEMGADLSLSPTELGWVVTSFGLGRLGMDLPAGRLADRVDPLRMFTLAALLMGLVSGLMAAAPSLGWILVATFLLGAGSATSNTTGMTALSGSAPDDRRGSAMALYSGSLLVGQAMGPVIGGFAASAGTWRAALATAAGLGLIVAAGSTMARRSGAGDRISRVRRQRPAPLGPPLSATQHLVLFGVGFSVFFTMGAMAQTLVPVMGADDLHLHSAAIGMALGAGGLSRIVGATLTGMVADQISRRAALLPCLVLQAGGVGLLAFGQGTAWWVLAIVTMSLGSSGTAIGATMLGDRARPAEMGRALGRYRFAGDIGLVSGPVLAAWIYDIGGRGLAVATVCAVLVTVVVAATTLPETGTRSTRR